jgi:transcriptional adapter 2-alpha
VCFGAGLSSGEHLPTHPFIVVDSSPPALFEEGWSAEEEVLLLSGIERCGFGNWKDISTVVKTKKASECEVHYLEVYLHSGSAPRPLATVLPPIPLPPPPPFSTEPIQSLPLAEGPNNTTENKTGYMARRHEFVTEWFDDAEDILRGCSADAESFSRTRKALAAYRAVLAERSLRMRVVEEWELHRAPLRLDNALGGSTGPEKELDAVVATFAPYIGREKTTVLAQSLHKLSRKIDTVESRLDWQRRQVTEHGEGFLLLHLEGLLEGSGDTLRIAKGKEELWNHHIREYLNERTERTVDTADMLTERELDLAKQMDIPQPAFFAMKDLIMREYTARGRLSREELIELAPLENQGKVEAMYELFVSAGWIIP